VARAELVLAHRDIEPLRQLVLEPDPLSSFAGAFQQLQSRLADDAQVAIDLLPLSPPQRRRLRKRLLRSAGHHTHVPRGTSALADEVLRELTPARRGRGAGRGAQRMSPGETVGQRVEVKQVADKLAEYDAMFHLQVLLRASSEVPGRAERHLQALISCFDVFAGQNYFRVRGLRLAGLGFLGADAPWRRGWFDRRMDGSVFAPARRSVVTSRELAGLLKPPTVHCDASNVLRLGGVIPPPPRQLPEYRRQPDVLPLGRVTSEDGGDKVVGLHAADSFFTLICGRARYGKTTLAQNQLLHVVRRGQGALFLDPHQDAIELLKEFLTDVGLAERVVEVSVAASKQLGWNLLAMKGAGPGGRDLGPDAIERKVSAVVDAFASALKWGAVNNRALTLTTFAAQSLIELAWLLPAEAAPTLFQITSLLSNEAWREEVIPYLSPPVRDFWINRFPHIAKDAGAVTPVTNLVDRLRASKGVAALLGSPLADYNIRRAMDEGKIVLAHPGAGSLKDQLLACLMVFDLLHSAKTRADTPKDRRRPFWAFLDEVTSYDGAAAGNLAALLEQVGKFEVKAALLTQNPERLTQPTLDAVTTNRSHLITSTVNAKAASMLAREWGGLPDYRAVVRLEKYTYVASTTIAGHIELPFLVRGMSVEEMWADVHHPERVEQLTATIDETCGRRPLDERIAVIEEHDERVLAHLPRRRGGGPAARSVPLVPGALSVPLEPAGER